MSEFNNTEIMDQENTKNFFEAAFDGIADAPTESKILLGIGAAVVSLGIGIGSFFWGKEEGRKEMAAEMNPNNQANQNTQNNQQANANQDQANQQANNNQSQQTQPNNNQQQNTQQQAQGQQTQQ